MTVVFLLYIISAVLTFFTSSTLLITLLKNRKHLFYDPKPTAKPKVSICIPVWNKENTVVKVIKNVLNLNYDNLEVIVVNDGSTDKSLEKIKKFIKKEKPKNLILINRKKNSGGFKSVPLNDALKVAKGEIFGFIDADTFIAKRDALSNIIGYFNDENVAAVVPSQRVLKPKNLLQRLQRIEYIIAALSRKTLTFLNSLYLTPGCAFFRRDLLLKLGGFDEKNRAEDLEMGLRLQKHGYNVQSTLNGFVYTIVPSTLKDLIRQRIRWNQGLIHNLKKYREMFFEKSNMGVFVFPFILFGGTLIIFLYLALLTFYIYDIVHNLWLFLNGFILSGYDIYLLSFKPRIEINIFFITSIFFSTLFLFSIYFSRKFKKLKLKNIIIDAILFLILYTPLLGIIWIFTIIEELRGREKW